MLPAASFLEFDDLVCSYFQLMLSAQVKAAEPLGDSLPNQEIFRRLARAMGYAEPELFEPDATVHRQLLRGTGTGLRLRGACAGSARSRSAASRSSSSTDLAFPTPSGRIEIASTRAEADGLPRVPLPLADPRPSGRPAAAPVARVDAGC